jgi:acyl-CoA synthetase (AMP-forming)/AMP-acid ligase II
MLIDELLIETALRLPDKTAVVHGRERRDYGSICSDALRFASALKDMGLERGDRVVIALENSVEYLIAYFGVLSAGCVAVSIHHSSTMKGFMGIARGCGPRALVAGHAFMRGVDPGAFPRQIRLIHDRGFGGAHPEVVGSISLDECLSAGVKPVTSAGSRTEGDLASILYTSGTTGEPKGVMLTHGNLVSNARSIVGYLGLTDNDSVMVVLPFCYSYGASLLHTHVMQGATLVIDNRFIYPNLVLDAMAAEAVTGFAGVPTTFAILCHRSNFKGRAFPALRYMTQAGGAMPHSLALEMLKTVPRVRFYVMYGQTEASARLSYLPPEEILRKAGSIGKAIPGVTLDVLDEDGRPVDPGDVGEITARGDNVMAGYWGNPEETAMVLRDGRLYTGDMATVDEDGFIYVVGRKRDMIKSGGHRIAPREIEEAVLEHPSVYEAAVVGVDDEILGEAVCAFVVLKEGRACAEDELLAQCRKSLPLYKMPKTVRFVRELPKTGSGKVKKQELRGLCAAAETNT